MLSGLTVLGKELGESRLQIRHIPVLSGIQGIS
jgi:hypothetical protein